MRAMKKKKTIAFVAMTATIVLLFPKPAHAYLDPGTGSYLLQLLIAGVLASLFAVKLFWKQVKTFLKKCIGKKTND